jgi:hypothetical protein
VTQLAVASAASVALVVTALPVVAVVANLHHAAETTLLARTTAETVATTIDATVTVAGAPTVNAMSRKTATVMKTAKQPAPMARNARVRYPP